MNMNPGAIVSVPEPGMKYIVLTPADNDDPKWSPYFVRLEAPLWISRTPRGTNVFMAPYCHLECKETPEEVIKLLGWEKA